jgi:hypothetical protein
MKASGDPLDTATFFVTASTSPSTLHLCFQFNPGRRTRRTEYGIMAQIFETASGIG